MKKQARITLLFSIGLLLVFAAWTVVVRVVDLQPIGPGGTTVGFAAMNGFYHRITGTHMALYTMTDWLGLIPLGVCVIFGALGFVQLVRRKNILKVDADILVLGVFYLVVIAFYLLFEVVPINYRPILINGFLEASYPSSTTLLTLCIMPTAVFQLQHRVKRSALYAVVCALIWAFSAFMVIGRLLSGVHWLTDIIGSVLLSGGLVMLYVSVCGLLWEKRRRFDLTACCMA